MFVQLPGTRAPTDPLPTAGSDIVMMLSVEIRTATLVLALGAVPWLQTVTAVVKGILGLALGGPLTVETMRSGPLPSASAVVAIASGGGGDGLLPQPASTISMI